MTGDHIEHWLLRRGVERILVTGECSPDELAWLRRHGIDPAQVSVGLWLLCIDRADRQIAVFPLDGPESLTRPPRVHLLEGPPLPFPPTTDPALPWPGAAEG